jgi:hypothetical protein
MKFSNLKPDRQHFLAHFMGKSTSHSGTAREPSAKAGKTTRDAEGPPESSLRVQKSVAIKSYKKRSCQAIPLACHDLYPEITRACIPSCYDGIYVYRHSKLSDSSQITSAPLKEAS